MIHNQVEPGSQVVHTSAGSPFSQVTKGYNMLQPPHRGEVLDMDHIGLCRSESFQQNHTIIDIKIWYIVHRRTEHKLNYLSVDDMGPQKTSKKTLFAKFDHKRV